MSDPIQGVAVLPMVRDGLSSHPADPVTLSRVPSAGELVRLPIGDFIVRGVRHTPGAETVADVWLDPVMTPAQREAQLAAARPADDQGSFAGVG